MTDEPILAYDNKLIGAPYAFLAGTDSAANPLSNAVVRDMVRVASPTVDGTGELAVEYAVQAAGDTFIIGADRHVSGGYRFDGGSVKVEALESGGWATVLDSVIGAAFNQSKLFDLAAHTAFKPAGWTTVAGGASVRGAVFGAGLWVLAGNLNVYTSSDNGLSWSTVAVGAVQFQDVAHDGTQFVLVGAGGTIYTSPDAATWTVRTSGVADSLNGVVWSGSQFVVAGAAGTLLASADGITWADNTATSGTTNGLMGVEYDGSQFIAVGVAGTIVTTTDGITGTVRTSGTAETLQAVRMGATVMVAVGNTGTIIFSYDGATWQAATSGTTNTLSAVAANGDTFKVVGSNALVESDDGLLWSSVAPITSATHRTIGYNGIVWLTAAVSSIYYLAETYRYKLTISGLAATSEAVIPELFIGPRLEMPKLDFNYDHYREVAKANTFESETGRVYNQIRYRRLQLMPKWSLVESTHHVGVEEFREEVLESRVPFWWAWRPDTNPTECYLMRHDGEVADFPTIPSTSVNPIKRFTSLKLVEAI